MNKVVVIGPESTGKSSLCEALAQHYQVQWCPEFAREYLLTNGKQYDYDDLLTIAKGQLAMEEEYAMLAANPSRQAATKPGSMQASPLKGSKSPLLFIDTDMYVMKVWSEFVFNKCHSWILNQIVHRKYDLYLLCNIDVPWVPDELREYPDLDTRTKLYHIYKDIMINQPTPWIDISGDYDERLRRAVKGVEALPK